MWTVVDFEHDGFFMRQGRAVHMALRIPIKCPGRQSHARLGVFVLSFEAEHELIRCVQVRLRDAGAGGELDQRNRRSALFISPEPFLRDARQRFFPTGNVVALPPHLLEVRPCTGPRPTAVLIAHSLPRCCVRAAVAVSDYRRITAAPAPAAAMTPSCVRPFPPAHRRISRAPTRRTGRRTPAACRAGTWR